MRLRFFLLMAIAILCGSNLRASTITGTVKGPDSAAFPGAFVEAQNLKTKITVAVLSDTQGHYRIENLTAGQFRSLHPCSRIQRRSPHGSEPHCRSERFVRFQFANGDGPLERHFGVPGESAFSRRARERPALQELRYLPRVSDAHGFCHAGRGWLERPSPVHAHSDGLRSRAIHGSGRIGPGRLFDDVCSAPIRCCRNLRRICRDIRIRSGRSAATR